VRNYNKMTLKREYKNSELKLCNTNYPSDIRNCKDIMGFSISVLSLRNKYIDLRHIAFEIVVPKILERQGLF
jgi:hypothetical protein